MAGGRIWTHDEIEILRQHYTSASREELTQMLPKRTWCSIKGMAAIQSVYRASDAQIAGLRKSLGRRRPWTCIEVEQLTNAYRSTVPTCHDLCHLFPDRSIAAIWSKVRGLGLTSKGTWSSKEDAVVIGMYNTANKTSLAGLLPHRSWRAIRIRAKDLGLPRRLVSLSGKYTANWRFFDEWTLQSAYVAGYWWADGCMTQPHIRAHIISFESTDKEHLELVRTIMQATHPVRLQRSGTQTTKPYWTLRIGSLYLWTALAKIGGTPRKSLTTKMPDIPDEYTRDFIRGAFDGDGCLIWTTNHIPRIGIVGTLPLLTSIADIIDRHVGVGAVVPAVKVGKLSTTDLTYSLWYSGVRAKAVAMWLYQYGDHALGRKANLAAESAQWTLSKRGMGKARHNVTPKMGRIMGIPAEQCLSVA